ncbi:MAG: hypothetical protein ACTSVL_01970 [Promethearchaeota archaeon]
MGKNGSSIGSILASIFITLILCGGGMFFGMPLIFPSLNDNSGGNLLQTKSVEVDTVDYINDFDLTYTKMPGMELDITTSGNSSLYVSFEGQFFLGTDNLFFGFTG